MLAQRVQLDVAYHHHVAMPVRLENPRSHDVLDARAIALREPPQTASHTLRRILETFAVRVLANQLELTPYHSLHLGIGRDARVGGTNDVTLGIGLNQRFLRHTRPFVRQKMLTLARLARSLATPAHKSTDTGHNMLLVGLTGNIASGKTTVAQLLSERGATII